MNINESSMNFDLQVKYFLFTNPTDFRDIIYSSGFLPVNAHAVVNILNLT